MLFVAPAFADAQRIDSFLNDLKTFQADFSQTVENEGGSSRTVKGVLYLSRPGKFRWDYEGDEAQLIVADGKRVWLLDRELEQVSHQGQASALRGTPAQLLSDNSGVDKHFTVQGEQKEAGTDWTLLQPKDEDSQVDMVRIGFSGKKLVALEMQDKFGQTTRFRFSDSIRNPVLAQELFRFKAPSGFDVWEH